MPSLESIQNKLLEVDASTFHRLGDDYFMFCSQIKFKEIKPIGLVVGKKAPKQGTPDTLIILDNEKYILVEYTTKESKKKSEYIKKLRGDLMNCQDSIKTGIKLEEIRQIILASSHPIPLKTRNEILSSLKSKYIEVVFCDIDFWAKEIRRHSFLAKHLGLPVETNQILTIDEYIREYEYGGISTPLSNKFLHRETELGRAKESIRENPIYILSGSPGVGKTKLALEAIRQYQNENPDTIVFCLKDKGSFSLDDVRTYFRHNKHYLVFIDDANRCARMVDLMTQSLLEGMTIRLVLTVREYARQELEHVLQNLKPRIDHIAPLEERALIDILRSVANFGRLAVNKILSLSLGNPRIALMAARVAKETNSLKRISNATEIFDQYFNNIDKEQKIFSSPRHIKCLGILSVFTAIDLSSEQARKILSSFNLDSQSFLGICK
ncbi:MAG TPA: hypothetical protein VGQ59_07905 [Cyclobacteriaceae bacterium]|jgi:hypothetical protein|nr:hypothetical protein [Cyclobacteriaceae bacterium]